MATVTYLQKSTNKETGNVAFIREQVLEIDGLHYGCRERDYGFGAGVTVSKLTKGYKSPATAEKALEKLQCTRTSGGTAYNQMATSRW